MGRRRSRRQPPPPTDDGSHAQTILCLETISSYSFSVRQKKHHGAADLPLLFMEDKT